MTDGRTEKRKTRQPETRKRRRIRVFTALAVVAGLLLYAWMILPRTGIHHGGKARRIQCISNLTHIGIALKMYAAEHNEQFPPNLYALVEEEFLAEPALFCCPSIHARPPQTMAESQSQFVCDYWYRPGFSERTAPSETGIVMDKMGNHTDYGNILFGDGHVKGFAGEHWYRNAGGMQAPPPENLRRARSSRPRSSGRRPILPRSMAGSSMRATCPAIAGRRGSRRIRLQRLSGSPSQ